MPVQYPDGARRRTTWARRLAATVVGVALSGAVLTACGGESTYRYVANREHGNFFKLPASWKLENVTNSEQEGRPEEMDSGLVSIWHTVFDGGAAPAATDALPTSVVGSAQIFAISNSYREQLSMSAIRSQAFGGVDPLFAPDDVAGSKVRVVSYVPIEGGDGVNGSRVVANVDLAPEGEEPQWITRDVSLLFDTGKGRIFLLAMGCESQCYLQNRAEIDGVAGSWTVRP